jgi:hypothetical protein
VVTDLISQVRNEHHLSMMEEALADAVEIYDKHKDGDDREIGAVAAPDEGPSSHGAHGDGEVHSRT